MPTVDVIIRTIDQSKGGVTSLTSNLAGLAAKYISVGAVATGVYKTVSESIKVTQDYARSVRDLAQVSGTSAEQASRLLQVLDDFEISAQDVTAATRFMTKAGLTPTIDTLAKLSDEYLRINDAQERNQFILDNLGRGGLQWVNVLKQGGSALRQMGDDVNANLILTDKAIQSTEEYRLAMDEWNDSVTAVKVSIGTGLMPLLTALISEKGRLKNATEALAIAEEKHSVIVATSYEAAQKLREAHEQTTPVIDSATRSYIAWGQAAQESAQSAEELAEAERLAAEQATLISEKNQMFLGVLGQVDSAMEAYYSGLREAKAALDSGSISTDEHKAKVAELSAAYQDAKNQIVLSIVEMKLASDGWTNAELNAYLSVGQQLGVFTQDQIGAANAAINMADALIGVEEPVMHVGERASDAEEGLGEMAEGANELANSLNQGATPAAAALARTIDSIPNKTVHIYIKVHGGGSFGLTTDQTSTGDDTTDLVNAGVPPTVAENLVGANASGGPMNSGGWTLVGDAPGGRLTPYSELITPNGYVLDAKTTRKLFESGMMGDFASMAFGGPLEGASSVRRGFKGPPGSPPKKPTDKTPNKDEEDEANSATFASDTASETAAFLAPTLQSAASAQQQSATNSSEQIAQQRRTNTLLQNLIDAQPSTLERFNEATFGQSLNS